MRDLVLLSAVLLATAASAQTEPDRYVLLGASVGPSLDGDGGGSASLALGVGDNLLILRASVADTAGDASPTDPVTGQLVPGSEQADLVRDLGVLVGRSLVRGPHGAVIASAGLAWTQIDLDVAGEFGSTTFEERNTVGVPVQLEVIGVPVPALPMGAVVRLGANVNATQTVGTAQVGVVLGGLVSPPRRR